MSRIVRCSLIQATNAAPPDASLEATKQAMIDKHVAYIRQAAAAGAQIVCLQEIFYGPYFCAEQTTRWYDFTEPVPDGPTIRLMQDLARQLHVALIVPIYEVRAGGRLLQHRRRHPQRRHLPRQVPQDPHPARRARLLGEILFPPRQPRLSRLRPGLRQDRRLHLLRPPLSRRRARPGLERRRDRLQSVGHRRRPQRISLEAGAAGARRGQRLLHRAPSIAWASRRPGTSANSTAPAISAIPAAASSRRRRATRTKC